MRPRFQKHCRALLLLWMVLALTALFAAPLSFLSDAAYATALPIAGFAAILLFDGAYAPGSCFARGCRSRALAAGGLSLLFLVMLPVSAVLRCPLFSEAALAGYWWPARIIRLVYLAWNWTGYLVGFAVSLFFSLDWILARFDRRAEAPAALSVPLTRSALLLRMLPILLVSLLCLFSVSPRMSTADDQTVWAQVTNGRWSDAHAVGYLFFVRLSSLAFSSRFSVLVVQTALLLFIQYRIVSHLSRLPDGARAVSAYSAVSALVFTPYYYLQCMLKDIPFSMSLLAFSFGICLILDARPPRKRDWVFFTVFALFTCLFRNESKLAVLGTLLLLALYCALWRRDRLRGVLLSALATACVWVLIVPVFAFNVLHAEQNQPYMMFSPVMYNACAVAAGEPELDAESVRLMEELMPLEKWKACYRKYNSDPASRPWSTIGDTVYRLNEPYYQKLVLRLTFRLLTRYPGAYLTAAFDQNTIVWEIARPSDSTEMVPILSRLASFDLPEEPVAPLGGSTLTHPYFTMLADSPILRTVLLRGGLSLFVLVVSAVVMLRQRRWALLTALLPVLFNTLLRLFSTPLPDTRYILPVIECACLFPILLFFTPPDAKKPATRAG